MSERRASLLALPSVSRLDEVKDAGDKVVRLIWEFTHKKGSML